MDTIRRGDYVREQYKDASNLKARTSIHDKYSVNKQGFGNWIFEQYLIREGSAVLELGCGNATMWKDRIRALPRGVSLTLTDLSEGMLEEARRGMPVWDGLSLRQMDIQDITFDDGSFDVVIANMMLYHVPDLHKGLSEVRRVLRSGGLFYCATYGENGIMRYISELFPELGVDAAEGNAFTLQNGEQALCGDFEHVEKQIYEDRLEITDTEDFIEYIMSLKSLCGIDAIPHHRLRSILESRKTDGILHVPKEYGMFVAY